MFNFNRSIITVVVAFTAAFSGWADSRVIDEAAEKKDIVDVLTADLFQTHYKIVPSEMGQPNFDSFEVDYYGADLKTYALSSNYTEIKAVVRTTITRGKKSCDAEIIVKKLIKYTNHDTRTDYLFAAKEWPYCLN